MYWGNTFVGELGRLKAGGSNVPPVAMAGSDSRTLENDGVELKHGAVGVGA
jgi:hypothetical protein